MPDELESQGMSPEAVSDVMDEAVAHQEQADNSVMQEQQQTPEKQSSAQATDAEKNWRRMRSEMEELQRTNKALAEALERNLPKKQEEPDEWDTLDDDDILTKKQAAKFVEKQAYSLAKKAAHELLKQKEEENLDEKVKHRYPDYSSVVNEDNLEELKRDPLFMNALKGLESNYDKACFVYEQLRLRGKTPTAMQEREQLTKNTAKPRSVNAAGGASPLHMANQYAKWPDPSLQEQLLKEMRDCAKGA